MKRKLVLIMALVLSLVLFAGCNNSNKIVGKWEMDYDNSDSYAQNIISNLNLNEDGTFVWDYNNVGEPEKLEHISGSYKIDSKIITLSGDSTTFKLEGGQLIYGGGINLVKVAGFRQTQIAKKGITKDTTNQVTQEDLNENLKQAAEKADFVKINGHTDEYKNIKVYAEGAISSVDYDNIFDIFPSFALSQVEGEGYGVYHITNALSVPDLKDGDSVIVYGVVTGVSNLGAPKISATVVEKR